MVLPGKLIKVIMAAAYLLPLFLFAQNRIYHEDFNVNLKIRAMNGLPERILSSYCDGILYSTESNATINNNTLVIHTFNSVTRSVSSIQVKKSKKNSEIFGRDILNIAVSGNKMVLLTSSKIFILRRESKSFYLIKTIDNLSTFTNIYHLNGENLLLYVNYHFHPKDEVFKHTWAKLNIVSDSLYPEKHMEEENTRFSYFSNIWIGTYKGLIAYARTTDYKITFYNDQFIPLDSIVSQIFAENRKVLNLIPSGNSYSSDEMKKIALADDTLLQRIEKIFLIDSLHLLVTVKRPKSKMYAFDLWKKEQGKWSIRKTDTIESAYIQGKEYNDSNNSISGFFGNHAGINYAGNGRFYINYFPFRKNIVSASFDRQKDFVDPMNELVRKNELFFGIRELELNMN